MTEVGLWMESAALRSSRRVRYPPILETMRTMCRRSFTRLKQEAERRLTEWATTGCGLISSSLYDASAWYSTGLGRSAEP